VEGLGESYSPVWHPNGIELFYRKIGGDPQTAVLRRRTDSTGEPQIIAIDKEGQLAPSSVSPDGKFLLLTQEHSPDQQKENIVLIDLNEAGPPRPLVATTANEGGAVFSPDGKWIAYHSNETGRYQVYVRAFPDEGRRWQVSTGGGYFPRWSRDGAKLHFVQHDAIHASVISTENGFSAGPSEKLFDAKQTAILSAPSTYDVFSNGEFIMVEPAEWEKKRPRIDVVVNWISELRTP